MTPASHAMIPMLGAGRQQAVRRRHHPQGRPCPLEPRPLPLILKAVLMSPTVQPRSIISILLFGPFDNYGPGQGYWS